MNSLKIDNLNLDRLVEKYFINLSDILTPSIGNYSFTNIYHFFQSSIDEYSKVDSKVISFSKNKTTEELLKLNNISQEDIYLFATKVNTILRNHTDINLTTNERFKVLKNQLLELTQDNCSYDDEQAIENKIYTIITNNDAFSKVKENYINKIIYLMKKAKVNQIKDNKYLVLEKMFHTRLKLNSYTSDFREKSKHLKKINDKNKQLKSLKKYLTKMTKDDIELFLWYLVHKRNKFEIYQVHNILGYSCTNILKLYKHLFFKQNKTAIQNNFLHHTPILNTHINIDNDILLKQILHYI